MTGQASEILDHSRFELTHHSLAQNPTRSLPQVSADRQRQTQALSPVIDLLVSRTFRRSTFSVLCWIFTALVTPASGGWLEAVEPSRPAPGLNLKDLHGIDNDLSQLKGKTVLVNFWTTWCPPCIEEMPSLIRLQREMGQSDFVVLAVNVQEKRQQVESIARRLKLTFPVLLDPDRSAGNTWAVKVFPSSFIVDAAGELRYRAIGPVEWDSAEASSILLEVIGR